MKNKIRRYTSRLEDFMWSFDNSGNMYSQPRQIGHDTDNESSNKPQAYGQLIFNKDAKENLMDKG
jgi:hypothetical protein